MIAEGVDEADYACYALRRYGIRPKDWAEMQHLRECFAVR